MSEKARALGIPEKHLTRALMLARHLRASALADGLDPRATRIAIIYLNLCDLHWASQKLNRDQLTALYEIAREFYEDQVLHT